MPEIDWTALKDVLTTLGAAAGLIAGGWRAWDEVFSRLNDARTRLTGRCTTYKARPAMLRLSFAYDAKGAHEGVLFTVTALDPPDLVLASQNEAFIVGDDGRNAMVAGVFVNGKREVSAAGHSGQTPIPSVMLLGFAPSAPSSVHVRVVVHARARAKRLTITTMWMSPID